MTALESYTNQYISNEWIMDIANTFTIDQMWFFEVKTKEYMLKPQVKCSKHVRMNCMCRWIVEPSLYNVYLYREVPIGGTSHIRVMFIQF